MYLYISGLLNLLIYCVLFQAYYRGYRLRKRLKAILEQAQYIDDEGGSDDFDYSQDIVIQELDEVRTY